MAKSSDSTQNAPGTERHDVDLARVRPGDVLRAVCEDEELDPVVVTAHWPHVQADFSPDRHREDSFVKTVVERDTSTRPPKTVQREKVARTGRRLTVVTRDRGEYAVVDWSGTEDPPLVYVKVFDSPDPERVRWERIDRLETLQRYGDEPDEPDPYFTGTPGSTPEPWTVDNSVSDSDFHV